MKYIVILPDGVSDVPLKELGEKTPLEVASHPNMDWVAREGICGWAAMIPKGLGPGSDVGCMSVFGYDPRKHYVGRAPIEAAAQGIEIGEGDVAFRCNTVFVKDGVMADYSAGHIESEDSAQLIEAVNKRLGSSGVRFHAGVSYRHLAIVESGKWKVESEKLAKTKCTPPHDISGKPIAVHLPAGPGASQLRELMKDSGDILRDHPVNQRRVRDEKHPANMLWFWGQGTAAKLPSFNQTYGLRAGCISAVDIVRGLGKLMDFDVIQVPGITGYFDTNYKGKAEYALKALDDHDLVLIHVEPTDEAGHMGDARRKIQAIEDTDRLVVGTVLEGLKARGDKYAILITPDHPTSTILKTHVAEPVPFALYVTGGSRDDVTCYSEQAIKSSSVRLDEGFKLMGFMLKQSKNATQGK